MNTESHKHSHASQYLTDADIDLLAKPWLCPDGQANSSDVRAIVRAAVSFCEGLRTQSPPQLGEQFALGVRAPAIGENWPEQGGIYIGQRLIDGQSHHIIVAPGIESDIDGVKFEGVNKAVDEVGEINGHNDWYAPEQEDLMLAYVNAPHQFASEEWASIYWSRSRSGPYKLPCAVTFNNGHVFNSDRENEFRVRPFRSIAASAF